MREWRRHEEFCLSNSLGVAAARVRLAADLFEQSPWWSCGIYDGKARRWICGLYRKDTAQAGIENIRHPDSPTTSQTTTVAITSHDDMDTSQNSRQFRLDPVNSSASTEPTRSSQGSKQQKRDMTSQNYLEIAAHFGRIPERRVCICPCLHARHNYFEARSQLRYCAMRTGFINAHNNRVMKEGHGDFHNLPHSFDFSEYISHILGDHLVEMVDVTPQNWLLLWVIFGAFMVVDFEDLLRFHTGGYSLAIASIVAAYISCICLFVVRNHTIEVEHKLLNETFMSFHVPHGVLGKLMCPCCSRAIVCVKLTAAQSSKGSSRKPTWTSRSPGHHRVRIEILNSPQAPRSSQLLS